MSPEETRRIIQKYYAPNEGRTAWDSVNCEKGGGHDSRGHGEYARFGAPAMRRCYCRKCGKVFWTEVER